MSWIPLYHVHISCFSAYIRLIPKHLCGRHKGVSYFNGRFRKKLAVGMCSASFGSHFKTISSVIGYYVARSGEILFHLKSQLPKMNLCLSNHLLSISNMANRTCLGIHELLFEEKLSCYNRARMKRSYGIDNFKRSFNTSESCKGNTDSSFCMHNW